MPCYFLSQNTWVSKTPHLMYLLLTLVILLLPESLLVICFINWHAEFLAFTTNRLIWRVGFHVPKYVWDSKFGIILRWSRTICHGVFSKSRTGYYIFIIIITNTQKQNRSVTVYIFVILYFDWWLIIGRVKLKYRDWFWWGIPVVSFTLDLVKTFLNEIVP